MSLFWKKPIYKCDILERYNLNIEKFNATATQSQPQRNYCRLIGENNKYNVYLFRDSSIASQDYLLRQEKLSPRKIVYLGRAQKFCCVLDNKILLMDSTRAHINFLHPKLICMDIETGKRTAFDILSPETVYLFIEPSGMGYELSQDCIKSMTIQNGRAVLEIARYEFGGINNLLDDNAFIYHLYISAQNGKLQFSHLFPPGKETNP